MIVFKFSQTYTKKFLNSEDSKTLLIFSLAPVVAELLAICDFSLNKSCKTYLGPVLPPGNKIWQLIYPYIKMKSITSRYSCAECNCAGSHLCCVIVLKAIDAERHYAKSNLCWVSLCWKSFMLSTILLQVIYSECHCAKIHLCWVSLC